MNVSTCSHCSFAKIPTDVYVLNNNKKNCFGEVSLNCCLGGVGGRGVTCSILKVASSSLPKFNHHAFKEADQ